MAAPAVLLGPPPAAAQTAGHLITDCSSEYGGARHTAGTPASGTVAQAVYEGGTWTFACGGGGPLTITFSAVLDVPAGRDVALLGGGQSVLLRGGRATRLFTVEGGLTLQGLSLEGGHSTGAGGAIDNQGTLTVSDSTFSGNDTPRGDGGAIANSGTLTVSTSTFSGNHAPRGDGGAIANSGTLTVSASTFETNAAATGDGGAIANSGTLTVSASAFEANAAATGDGGAIANSGTLTVSASAFEANAAAKGDGGAIANRGALTLSTSTFRDNRAPDGEGGAIGNQGTLTVSNSTFAGNSAPHGEGGAIANAGTLTVANATLSGNGALQGGNLWGGGVVRNTVVASPTSGGNCSGGTASGTHDLEYGDRTCASGTTGVWTTGAPNLQPLAGNGGPTDTMALGAGSAAIGAGDPGICAAAPVGGRDQRGFGRPAGVCDAGAYQTEARGITVTAVPAAVAASQTATVTAAVYSESGAALPDQTVSLTLPAGSGTLGPVTGGADGGYTATYRAPAVVPAANPVTVTASVYSQVSGTLSATASIAVVPVPAVTAIGPKSGSVAGGTKVGVTGSGFQVAGESVVTAVEFGPEAATGLTVLSAGHLTATAPAGSGTVDVRVVTAGGTSATTSADLFTYSVPPQRGAAPVPAGPAVQRLSPGSGPSAGGTTVIIDGEDLTAPATVMFGPRAALAVRVQSPARLTATSPPGSGTVDVRVTTAGGTSPTVAADRFTYTAPAHAARPSPTFADVPAGYWAYPYIEQLAGRGIVNGFPDGTFRPGAPVTRAQFVKMLVLVLGVRAGGESTAFRDMKPGDWFSPYVEAGVAAGIVNGLSPARFGPNRATTREQMAVMLARALKLTQTATLRFPDDPRIDSWALRGVEAVVPAGYFDGFPDGSFQPVATATRAQAAKVAAMVLDNPLPAAASGATSTTTRGSGS